MKTTLQETLNKLQSHLTTNLSKPLLVDSKNTISPIVANLLSISEILSTQNAFGYDAEILNKVLVSLLNKEGLPFTTYVYGNDIWIYEAMEGLKICTLKTSRVRLGANNKLITAAFSITDVAIDVLDVEKKNIQANLQVVMRERALKEKEVKDNYYAAFLIELRKAEKSSTKEIIKFSLTVLSRDNTERYLNDKKEA